MRISHPAPSRRNAWLWGPCMFCYLGSTGVGRITPLTGSVRIPWPGEAGVPCGCTWCYRRCSIAVLRCVRFVAEMNRTTAALGMAATTFANPHGLMHPQHTSCAEDVAVLATAAMRHPVFRTVVSSTTYACRSQLPRKDEEGESPKRMVRCCCCCCCCCSIPSTDGPSLLCQLCHVGSKNGPTQTRCCRNAFGV